MTRAEKYEEVFGIKPDTEMCPTERCCDCPCFKDCLDDLTFNGQSPNHDDITEIWWNGEYNENE